MKKKRGWVYHGAIDEDGTISIWEELEHGLKGMPLPEYIEGTAKGTLISINGKYFVQKTEKINE